MNCCIVAIFFFSSRRRHTRCSRDWSSDVCSSDLSIELEGVADDALQLELGGTDRERVEDFREAAAVLRGGQTVEEGSLGICHLDMCFTNPDLVYSEESVGLCLDELVARPCHEISAARPTISC